KILHKERPDALLPTMGGQTALNTALELAKNGTLRELNIELIGAKKEAIELAEDRELFKKTMDKLGLESPKSKTAHNFQEALDVLEIMRGLALGRRSEEHTSELQSLTNLVCRLLLEKKKNQQSKSSSSTTESAPIYMKR